MRLLTLTFVCFRFGFAIQWDYWQSSKLFSKLAFEDFLCLYFRVKRRFMLRMQCELNTLLFQNFWIRVGKFFKFENPSPVQTPATILNPSVICPCFYLRNDQTNSCCYRNWKVTPVRGLVFPKFLTPGPDPGPKEKRTIVPQSTPALRIRSHLWCALGVKSEISLNTWSNPN